jgi:hypothetical protein
MFKKIGRAAERMANNVGVSRRGFLGRLGQAALGTAAVLGGVLASPTGAQAFSFKKCFHRCCMSYCGNPTCSSCIYSQNCTLLCLEGRSPTSRET